MAVIPRISANYSKENLRIDVFPMSAGRPEEEKEEEEEEKI